MLHDVSSENTKIGRSNGRSDQSEKITLDDKSISKLKPSEKKKTYWFKGFKSFGMKVEKTGKKSFVFTYRFKERKRWMTFGNYPELSVSQAHKMYADAFYQNEKGEDPAEKLIQDKIDYRETPLFKDVVDQYIQYSIKTGKKSWKKEARYLERDAVPHLGWKKIDEVKRREVAQLVNKIIFDRGSIHAACEFLQYMKRLYNVSISWGYVEYNPCDHIRKPAKARSRDRVLFPDEIYRFWNRLDDCNAVLIIRLALRFTLLTMTRKCEVRFLEWDHINFNTNIWTLPKEHSKNGRLHMIPLSKTALSILEQVKPFTGHSKYVFGSTRVVKKLDNLKDNLNPLNTTAMSHALRKNMKVFSVTENFTVHDLRRTGATLITSLGCPRYWASLLLNHSERGVTSIYDRYSYDWERKCGMDVLDYAVTRIASSPSEREVPSLSQLRHEIEKEGILKFRYTQER